MIPPRVRGRLLREILRLPGFELGSSHFSPDEAFYRSGHHIAQLDLARGGIEIRLTRRRIAARRDELAADPRIDLRHRASEWVWMTLRIGKDATDAVAIVREAAEANVRR